MLNVLSLELTYEVDRHVVVGRQEDAGLGGEEVVDLSLAAVLGLEFF